MVACLFCSAISCSASRRSTPSIPCSASRHYTVHVHASPDVAHDSRTPDGRCSSLPPVGCSPRPPQTLGFPPCRPLSAMRWSSMPLWRHIPSSCSCAAPRWVASVVTSCGTKPGGGQLRVYDLTIVLVVRPGPGLSTSSLRLLQSGRRAPGACLS
jgi:hypothetical protein